MAELEPEKMNLKRFLLLGNILVTALILWAGVSIVITFASNWRSEDPALSVPSKMSVPKNTTSSAGKRLEDYALIAAKDVFHTTKTSAMTTRKGETGDIKVTELNLELKGTAVGDGKDSYAFIMDMGSREEQAYYVNDYVMGAQIVRIMKDKIILNVGGREETLLMVSLEEKQAPKAVTQGVRRPISPSTIAPPQSAPPQRRVITPRRGGGTGGGS